LKSRNNVSNGGKKFPLILCTDYNLDTYRNLVLSREIKGFEIVRNARWIKINPEDAKTLKLKDGELIIVESASGKRNGVAKITEAVPKGTVRASFLIPQPVKIKRGK